MIDDDKKIESLCTKLDWPKSRVQNALAKLRGDERAVCLDLQIDPERYAESLRNFRESQNAKQSTVQRARISSNRMTAQRVAFASEKGI